MKSRTVRNLKTVEQALALPMPQTDAQCVKYLRVHHQAEQLLGKASGEIETLYAEIVHRIGTLLNKKRKELKHGRWLPWIKKHCLFSDDSALNYMKLAQRATVADCRKHPVTVLYREHKIIKSRKPTTPYPRGTAPVVHDDKVDADRIFADMQDLIKDLRRVPKRSWTPELRGQLIKLRRDIVRFEKSLCPKKQVA